MNSLYIYDRILALHQEDLLRKAQRRRFVLVAEAANGTARNTITRRACNQLGRWLVAWGMRVQALPRELPRLEYVTMPAVGEQCGE
jgi:hypothetical protein